jgi:hypothetical protein
MNGIGPMTLLRDAGRIEKRYLSFAGADNSLRTVGTIVTIR